MKFSAALFFKRNFRGAMENQLGPSKVLKIFKISRVGILRLGKKMRDSEFQENSKHDPKKQGKILDFCISLGKSRVPKRNTDMV